MFGAEAAGGQFGADWDGGHTFSQSAVDFSLQEYIEPEVVRKNPHLSPDEVRFEASRVLALRLVQDLSFDRKETLRDEEMVTKWEAADIDGKKQLVTRYGDRNVSLEELWRHTEEFALRVGKPGAFNRAEMQTQLAIQDALIAGRATSAAFTLSHPESVRYVQQWQMREDGAFYSKQIDIGKHAGRDLRHDEVKGFLDSFRDQHRDTAIEVEGAVAGSYVAVRGAINTAVITRTIMFQTLTTSGEVFDGRRYSLESIRHIPDLSDRVNPFWVVADRRWFEESKRADHLILDRIRDKEKKDIPQQSKSIDTQEKPTFTHTTPVHQEGSSDGKIIRKEYDARRTARRSLQIVAETGVAIHAVPEILAKFAEKLPVSVLAIEKSMRRHEGKVRTVRKVSTFAPHYAEATRGRKATVGWRAVREEKKKLVRIESMGKGKERKRREKRRKVYMGLTAVGRMYTFEKSRKHGKEMGVKRVAVAEKLTPSVSEKRETRKIRRLRRVVRRAENILETKRVPKEEKKLWVVLAVAAAEFNPTPHKSYLLGQENMQPEREQGAVAGVRFAWVLWMLLGAPSRHSSTRPSKEGRIRIDNKKPEIITKHVQAPWILLSIIYYLTAIREQGMRNNPQLNTTPLLQARLPAGQGFAGQANTTKTLPMYGVIFAHVS